MKVLALAGLLILGLVFSAAAQVYDTLPVVHDPVMIKENGIYHVFCTGEGITTYSSPDRRHWKKGSPVFSKPPQWALKRIPGFKGIIWAPDISFHNGLYYLYYAVSAFGKNTSAIGVATNKTLDTSAADFLWKDEGMVVQSIPGRDLWNAIDPNLVVDDENVGWLAFGSFWNGIKLVKLRSDLLSIAQLQQWYSIASRKRENSLPDSVAGDGAIEAPFIFRKDSWYYLFVSFDYCCRGERSTYKMMVGRSKNVFGPYVDKDGVGMTAGGGSLVQQGDSAWYGVGHNAVLKDGGNDYLIFHGYDAHDNAKPKLRIEQLWWKDGWPSVSQ